MGVLGVLARSEFAPPRLAWLVRPGRGSTAPIKDGMMEVAPGPGFGLVLDDAMIQRYRVA